MKKAGEEGYKELIERMKKAEPFTFIPQSEKVLILIPWTTRPRIPKRL